MADSTDKLFRELCKPELLKVGWHLAQSDSRDDFILDPVGYEDFAANLTSRLAWLISEIRSRRYRPRHLIDVDVPKSAFSVRPGSVLPIEEATVLHAIVYLIAPRLDSHLSKNVYSYRLHKDWKQRIKKNKSMFDGEEKDLPFLKGKTIRQMDPFEPWYTAWPDFDKARLKAAKESGYTHLTRTDIASYFENIDLRLLESQLLGLLRNEPHIVSLLMRIIESWTRPTSTGTPVGRGIPQGNEVSSFLGNLYLLPLDRALNRFCEARDAIWFRYVDDVEVYSRDATTARDVVFVINESLRSLYLNLQGSKTEVLSGKELDDVLATSESEAVEAAINALEGVDARNPKNSRKVHSILVNLDHITFRFLSGIPETVRSLTKRDSALLRRMMTLWGSSADPQLKPLALAALATAPELRMLNKSLSYLQKLSYDEHGDITTELLALLERGTFVLPFHAARVIEAIRMLHPKDGGTAVAGRISAWAMRRKRAWPVQQKALEALAVFPYREAHALARAKSGLVADHPFVRRAALVLLTRAPVQQVREMVADLLYDPDPNLGRLALLWHRNLTDEQFALRELAGFRKGNKSDHAIVSKLPRLWLWRCNPSAEVCRQLHAYVNDLRSKTVSVRLQWHLSRIARNCEWAISPP